jgi:hypothetical protein
VNSWWLGGQCLKTFKHQDSKVHEGNQNLYFGVHTSNPFHHEDTKEHEGSQNLLFLVKPFETLFFQVLIS